MVELANQKSYDICGDTMSLITNKTLKDQIKIAIKNAQSNLLNLNSIALLLQQVNEYINRTGVRCNRNDSVITLCMELLSHQQTSGILLGDELITDCFAKNQILSPILFLFYSSRLYANRTNEFPFINIISQKIKGRFANMDIISHQITSYYNASLDFFNEQLDGDPMAINVSLLLDLHHEFVHYDNFILKTINTNNETSKAIGALLIEITDLISKLSEALYRDNHDFLIAEYFADFYGMRELEQRLMYYKVSQAVIDRSINRDYVMQRHCGLNNGVRTVSPLQKHNQMVAALSNSGINPYFSSAKDIREMDRKNQIVNDLVINTPEITADEVGVLVLTSEEIGEILQAIKTALLTSDDLIAETDELVELIADIEKLSSEEFAKKYNETSRQGWLLRIYRSTCGEPEVALNTSAIEPNQRKRK